MGTGGRNVHLKINGRHRNPMVDPEPSETLRALFKSWTSKYLLWLIIFRVSESISPFCPTLGVLQNERSNCWPREAEIPVKLLPGHSKPSKYSSKTAKNPYRDTKTVFDRDFRSPWPTEVMWARQLPPSITRLWNSGGI